MSRRLKRLRLRLAKGLALLAALGLLGGQFGFPVAPVSDGEFPCRGHGCGCSNAATCWLGCCCLSPADRLAWAKAHDVTPPAGFLALLAEAKDADSDASPADSSDQSRQDVAGEPAKHSCCGGNSTCCVEHEPAACCEPERNALARTVPEQASSHTKEAKAGQSDEETESPLPLLSAGRCQGLAVSWIAGGQPLALPLRPVALNPAGGSTALMVPDFYYRADRAAPPARPG